MKKCNKCQITKPLIEYTKDKSRKDGLTGYCKKCGHLHHKKRNLLPKNKLRSIISVRFNLNKNLDKYTNGKTWREELGCELEEWQVHLEKHWYGDMDWDNFGIYWQIHHIEPLHLNQNYHYTNTKPITLIDHRIHHSKYGY